MIKETMYQGAYSGNILYSKSGQNYTVSLTQYNRDNYNDKLHVHKNAHFSFMINGGCMEKKKFDYELLPGDLTYYNAGEKHQVIKVAKDSKRINLEFNEAFLDSYGLSNNRVKASVSKNPESRFLLLKVYKELLVNDAFSDLSIQMLFLKLTSPKFIDQSLKRNPKWVSIIDEYLRSNLDRKLTLNELSSICKLHPVTLSKLFPIYFDCTLGQYKRKLMVQKTLPLILSSELSLCEIALECGFFDQSHFTRTFKEIIGVSPKNYRLRY
ncbi:helix-turn-helix domain-containing protein [Ulvibacterium marinum]|uniref:AraC family transcriptional regulator n=1 Tax=Ulvibacterium marinum TaxID=2419782 RepID=A0A3B0BRJ3_9FLAO|nr:AraC family transcriptional regulator [Ulvibacterium marinum]RKN75955.1 AraC family transcriptional regulator [Ulvibacterium marinum]